MWGMWHAPLCRGELALPLSLASTNIPVTKLGQIAARGSFIGTLTASPPRVTRRLVVRSRYAPSTRTKSRPIQRSGITMRNGSGSLLFCLTNAAMCVPMESHAVERGVKRHPVSIPTSTSVSIPRALRCA